MDVHIMNFAFHVVRTAIVVKDFFVSTFCPRKVPVTRDKVTYEESWRTEDDIVFHTVRQTDTNGDVREKIGIHYVGYDQHVYYPLEAMFKPCRPPWFFIGCNGAEDKTTDMEPYICMGNVIRNELLQHLFPRSKRWVYIHPVTFEETVFPSKGISIEND